jgi:branched-chain amino acid transport system permease protein/neutral amino acid transport system permease protein
MHEVILAFGFGIVAASVIVLPAVGFTLQFGISGVFNVSYGAMMTAAAYLAYYVDIRLHTDMVIGLVAGGLGGAIMGVTSERLLFSPFLRRGAKVYTVVMVSFAVDIVVASALLAIGGSGFFSYGLPPESIIHILGTELTALQLELIALGVAAMIGTHLLLKTTKLGKSMRAVSADPSLAGACGINVARITSATWALSGFLAGLGGVALGINTAAFSAQTGDTFVFVAFAAAIVGGLGRPYGAMLGALLIGIITEEVSIWSPSLNVVAAFAVVVVILLTRPAGLARPTVGTRKDSVVS